MTPRISVLGAALVMAAPLFAADGVSDLGQRLRDMAGDRAAPRPTAEDLYGEAIRTDLAMIAAQADRLFGDGFPSLGTAGGTAAIALFVTSNCADCKNAIKDLRDILETTGQRATLIDVSDPANAALMQALTLDRVPSYVMPDRLIRGTMPAFVLERYLRAAR